MDLDELMANIKTVDEQREEGVRRATESMFQREKKARELSIGMFQDRIESERLRSEAIWLHKEASFGNLSYSQRSYLEGQANKLFQESDLIRFSSLTKYQLDCDD